MASTMTPISIMVTVGLLEKILASKAAVAEKAREQKKLLLKVTLIMHFMVRHVDILKSMQKINENHIAGEAIRRAALKGMCTQRSDDEIIPDSEEERIHASCALKRHRDEDDSEVDLDDEGRANPHHGPKRHHRSRNKQEEKYDAIFQLLERAEERGKRMEMRAEENRKDAFEQAEKALESYNQLSEQILHAIINIGSCDNV